MKKLLVILLLFPAVMFSQLKLDTIQQDVYFSKVYEIKKTKKELYQKTNEWIAINFKDANEVIKLNTEEKVIAKGFFNISYNYNGFDMPCKIYFVLEVAFKENKYKLDMHTFNLIQNENTLPVRDYYFSNDYNYYLKILKEQSSVYTDRATIKYYERLFKKPEKLKEMFQKYRGISEQITSEIDLEVTSTALSLLQYISKKSSDDW